MRVHYIDLESDQFIDLTFTDIPLFTADYSDDSLKESVIKVLEDLLSFPDFNTFRQRYTCEVYQTDPLIFTVRGNHKSRVILHSRWDENRSHHMFILGFHEEHKPEKTLLKKPHLLATYLSKVEERLIELKVNAQSNSSGSKKSPQNKRNTISHQFSAGKGVITLSAAGTLKTTMAKEWAVSHLENGSDVLFVGHSEYSNAQFSADWAQLNQASDGVAGTLCSLTPTQIIEILEQQLEVRPNGNPADYSFFYTWISQKQREQRNSGVSPKKKLDKGINLLTIAPFDLYAEFMLIIQPGDDLSRAYLTLNEYRKISSFQDLNQISALYELFEEGYLVDLRNANRFEPNIRLFDLYSLVRHQKGSRPLLEVDALVVDQFTKSNPWLLYLLFSLQNDPTAGHWFLESDAYQVPQIVWKQVKIPLTRMLTHITGVSEEIDFFVNPEPYQYAQKISHLGQLLLAIRQKIWGSAEREMVYGLSTTKTKPLGTLTILPCDYQAIQMNEEQKALLENIANNPSVMVLIPDGMDNTSARELFGQNVFYVSDALDQQYNTVVLLGFSALDTDLDIIQASLDGELPEVDAAILYSRKKEGTTPSPHVLNTLLSLYTAVTRAQSEVIICDENPHPFLLSLISHVEQFILSKEPKQLKDSAASLSDSSAVPDVEPVEQQPAVMQLPEDIPNPTPVCVAPSKDVSFTQPQAVVQKPVDEKILAENKLNSIRSSMDSALRTLRKLRKSHDEQQSNELLGRLWGSAKQFLSNFHEPELAQRLYAMLIPFSLQIKDSIWLSEKLKELARHSPDCLWTVKYTTDALIDSALDISSIGQGTLFMAKRAQQLTGTRVFLDRYFRCLDARNDNKSDLVVIEATYALSAPASLFQFNKRKSELFLFRGDALLHTNRVDAARKDYISSLHLYYSEASCQAYINSLKQGSKPNAIEFLPTANMYPKEAMVHYVLACIHFVNSEWKQAVQEVSKAIQMNKAPIAEQWYLKRAEAHWNLGNMDSYLGDMHHVALCSIDSLKRKAKAFSSLLKHQDAISCYNLILQSESYHFELLIKTAEELILLEQFDKADEKLRRYCTLSENEPDSDLSLEKQLIIKSYSINLLQDALARCEDSIKTASVDQKSDYYALKALIVYQIAKINPQEVEDSEKTIKSALSNAKTSRKNIIKKPAAVARTRNDFFPQVLELNNALEGLLREVGNLTDVTVHFQ